MIKYLKVKNIVYTNLQLENLKDEKPELVEIFNNLENLRNTTIDTYNWLIGREVKKASGNDTTKLIAGNSKAIVLLLKLIDTLNPDESNLTDTEKEILTKLRTFGQQGYSDSEMLDNMLDSVLNNINVYSQKIEKAQQATSVDELIELLEE